MLVEQYFVDMSRHPKPIDPEWAAQIAEHIEKKGVTDLDAPGAPKRKIPRTDAQLRELEGIEKAKAERKSQAEHNAALARLADGTAIHRQKSTKNEVLKKVRAIKSAKPKAAKAAKKIAKPAKKKLLSYKLRCSVKQIGRMQLDNLQKTLAIQNRRKAMIETLKSGASVQSVSWRGESLSAHQAQKRDLDVIEIDEALDIVRVHEMRVKGLMFMVDNFERYDMPAPISCYLSGRDREKLFTAIRSGKLVSIDDFKEDTPTCARVMFTLTHKHGLNIHSVMKKNKTLGWILLEEEPEPKKSYAEVKRESEVNGLGDMLQAIDYLKIRREVQVSMPGATAGEIEEAAFQEFKKAE